MTLTLTADIDAQTRYLTVTGTVPDSIEGGYRFRLGDEALELQGFVMPQHTVTVDRNRWYVRRAQDGSAGATHTTGTEVKGANDAFVSATSGTTPPNPFTSSPGGSGIPQGGPLTEPLDGGGFKVTNVAPGEASGDVATVGQLGGAVLHGEGAPTNGIHTYFEISSTAPNASGSYTLTFGAFTTDPIDATTGTGQDIADAMNAAAGELVAQPYPGYGALTPNDETYVIFIGALGGQSVPIPTVGDDTSDGGIEVSLSEDGVAPVPAATAGTQYIDDLTDALYQYNSETPPNSPGPVGWTTLSLTASGFAINLLGTARQIWAYLGAGRAEDNTTRGTVLTGVDAAGSGTGQHGFYALGLFNIEHLSGTAADPSADAGVAAHVGSYYSSTTDGTEWKKTGSGDTDWQQLAFVP